MSAAPQPQKTPHFVSEEEYLRIDTESDTKHEYLGGEIVAMSGASARHNAITFATATTLGRHIDPSQCIGYSSDMRVAAPNVPNYMYPDVVIVCGDPEFKPDVPDTLLNPTLLVEVLSPSTSHRDKGDKLDTYRSIPSVQDVLLVAQDRPHVIHYTRQADAFLVRDIIGLDATITLQTLAAATIELSELYQQVRFDEQA